MSKKFVKMVQSVPILATTPLTSTLLLVNSLERSLAFIHVCTWEFRRSEMPRQVLVLLEIS